MLITISIQTPCLRLLSKCRFTNELLVIVFVFSFFLHLFVFNSRKECQSM